MESAAAAEILELTSNPTISRTELLDEDEADIPEQCKCTGMSIWTVTLLIGLVIGSTALISSPVIPKLAYQLIRGLNLWKWELLILSIFSACLLSRCFIHLLVSFFGRNFFFRNQLLYFIYTVRRPLKRCMWFGLILLGWHFLLSAAVESKRLSIITNLLIWAFAVSLLCLAKTLMLKILGITFHLDKYFGKIHDGLTFKHIVDRLLGPQNPMMQNLHSQQHGEASIDQLGRLNKYNISAWYMARIKRTVMQITFTTLDEQMARQSKGDECTLIKLTARKLFTNVATPGAEFVKEDLALKCMRSLNQIQGQEEGVSERVIMNWLANVFRERKSLSTSIKDIKMVVNQLCKLANSLIAVIAFTLFVLCFNLTTAEVICVICTQALLFQFIYGEHFKTIFRNIIFLFITHLFDVGDRCEINGVEMTVEEMNIFTTTFQRFDNLEIVFPNSVVAMFAYWQFQ